MECEEKYYVMQAMEKFGGSFVKCLGKALIHADSANTQKIKYAFPEDWVQYLEMGKKMED